MPENSLAHSIAGVVNPPRALTVPGWCLDQGILIYRDADIKEAYPVKRIPVEQLKKGDLLFFPGHVAMYLGEGKYIHATGYYQTPYVTINSLKKSDPDYRSDLAENITECGQHVQE